MSGASTPSEDQFSYQQALVMQRKVVEALASYEDIIAALPNAIEPRVRAAELRHLVERYPKSSCHRLVGREILRG